jgi:hypothetical protein
MNIKKSNIIIGKIVFIFILHMTASYEVVVKVINQLICSVLALLHLMECRKIKHFVYQLIVGTDNYTNKALKLII